MKRITRRTTGAAREKRGALKVNGVVQNRIAEVQEIPGAVGLQSEGAAIEFRNIRLYLLDE